MKKFNEYFKDEFRSDLAEENINILKSKINSGNGVEDESMNNKIKVWGLKGSLEDYKKDVLNDRLTASFFATDPSQSRPAIRCVSMYLNWDEDSGNVNGISKGYNFKHEDKPVFLFIPNGTGGAQSRKVKEAIEVAKKLDSLEKKSIIIVAGDKYSENNMALYKEIKTYETKYVSITNPDELKNK